MKKNIFILVLVWSSSSTLAKGNIFTTNSTEILASGLSTYERPDLEVSSPKREHRLDSGKTFYKDSVGLESFILKNIDTLFGEPVDLLHLFTYKADSILFRIVQRRDSIRLRVILCDGDHCGFVQYEMDSKTIKKHPSIVKPSVLFECPVGTSLKMAQMAHKEFGSVTALMFRSNPFMISHSSMNHSGKPSPFVECTWFLNSQGKIIAVSNQDDGRIDDSIFMLDQ